MVKLRVTYPAHLHITYFSSSKPFSSYSQSCCFGYLSNTYPSIHWIFCNVKNIFQMSSISRFVKFNNRHVMPVIGLGTFVMAGEKIQEAVEHAISIGIHWPMDHRSRTSGRYLVYIECYFERLSFYLIFLKKFQKSGTCDPENRAKILKSLCVAV